MNARLRNGLQLQAGTNTGQRVTDYCEIRAKLPGQTGGFSTGSEVPAYSPVNPYCHYAPGIRHAGHGRRLVHDPEDRRAAQRRLPEQPRDSALGKLRRARGHHRAERSDACRRAT